VIFYGSSQSRFFIQPPEFFSSDKVYHFFEYGLLGVLTVRVMGAYRIAPDRPVAWATLFCLLYGISDEFHQWFVPGRFATLGDVLADTLGGWTGARLYAWRTVRPGRRKG
jgi:VanZ family protein